VPILSFLVAASLYFGFLYMQNTQRALDDAAQGEAKAVAGNMSVYRNAVIAYAKANPAASGAVGDAALSLPSWFVHNPQVLNYVASGKGYVYYAGAQPELAYLILKSNSNTILAGIKKGGYLVNPLSGTTVISLPGVIPDGSVVYSAG